MRHSVRFSHLFKRNTCALFSAPGAMVVYPFLLHGLISLQRKSLYKRESKSNSIHLAFFSDFF